MTREEAIEQLQNCKELILQDGKDWFDERDLEVLDMAISALSEEETLKSQLANCHKEILRFLLDDDFEKVVRCRDCFMHDECKAKEWYGEDGYCSVGDKHEDDDNYFIKLPNDVVEKNDDVIEHDREWIIGCIKHDGFIKTDRFDKANQIILDALEPSDLMSHEEAWKQIESDLISRADAIEAVVNMQDGSGQTYEFVREAMFALKALPSADAEFADLPDIPRAYYERIVGNMAHEINMLKEQLESADAVHGEWNTGKPTKGGKYIVTLIGIGDYRFVDIMHYDKPCMPNKEVSGACWYRDDDEWGDVVYDDKDIIAWIPLPKPYKGGAKMKGGAE